MMMGFAEGSIAEEKLFGDVVFPKTLRPSSPGSHLAELIQAERVLLEETLRRHGAILFRGFDVGSAAEFERAVEAFGWEADEHVVAATRQRVSDRVVTANMAPPHLLINFHHETSLFKKPASKIFFFCSEPSPEGGETSIVPSNIVVEKMEERLPELVAKLAEVGLVFRATTPKDSDLDAGIIISKTWKWVFQTEDEAEAEEKARRVLNVSSVNFNDDGSAEFVYGPANPVKEFGGKRAWFVPMLGYTSNIEDVKRSFGDGSEFPADALKTYGEILEENCVDVKWEKGDVLLLDNLSVQHARRPGKPPRVILASLCK